MNDYNTEGDNSELTIDYYSVRKAVKVLRAINHAMRQKLIKTIHDNKKITVTEIYIKLRVEQSVASQHLAVLRKAGIVSTQRDGKKIYYQMNYDRLKEINELVRQM